MKCKYCGAEIENIAVFELHCVVMHLKDLNETLNKYKKIKYCRTCKALKNVKIIIRKKED